MTDKYSSATYVSEKLGNALHAMGAGEGAIRMRAVDAWRELAFRIDEADFPSGDRARFKRAATALRNARLDTVSVHDLQIAVDDLFVLKSNVRDYLDNLWHANERVPPKG